MSYSLPNQTVTIDGPIVTTTATPVPGSPPAGGTYTYDWDLASNPFQGLSLNTSSGEISGSPTTIGLLSPTVTITGSGTASGAAQASLNIEVYGTDGPGAVGDANILVHWIVLDPGLSLRRGRLLPRLVELSRVL